MVTLSSYDHAFVYFFHLPYTFLALRWPTSGSL